MCNRSDICLQLLVSVFVVLECVQENSAVCNTFSKAIAEIKIQGKYNQVELSGCLENSLAEEIKLTGCLKIIQQGTFSNMERLKTIIINAGNLKSILPNFTINTPSLKHISINMNALTKINKEVFTRSKLEKLNLGSNKINSIDENAFKDTIIENLILDDNKLKNIESKWFQNSTITNLFLGNNQINYIQSDSFRGIRKLKEINLSYNFINYINGEAFLHLKYLRNLNLTGNALTHLNFLNNLKLTKLDVGFNRISYIFLDKNISIKYFFIFPNPWQCNCLQEFWKFATVNKIGVGNTPSTKSTWRDVYPVCVAQNPNCSKMENYDEIRLQYFKNVNYAKLDN